MKDRIIELLKNQNDYISGEEIGRILGVSRTAVWKKITKLKNMGYKIESVSNKGYCLIDSVDVFDTESIEYKNIIHMEEVDSTSEECKRQAAKGAKSGLLIVADSQTKGKGRLGRSWVSNKNQGLFMSMLLFPSILPVEVTQITLVAGIAVMRALKLVTGLKVQIKWPNDIVYKGKKLTGILTEMSAEMDKINYVVLGIGINVNYEKFNDELVDKGTSIYIETGKRYKRSDIVNAFINEFFPLYEEFCAKGFSGFVKEYNCNCANIGKNVKTVGTREQISGIAKGVNERGELIIASDTGEKAVFAGEVSIRLVDGRYI